MLEVTGLDRDRALGWTLVRILQNVLWDLEDGETRSIRASWTIARPG